MGASGQRSGHGPGPIAIDVGTSGAGNWIARADGDVNAGIGGSRTGESWGGGGEGVAVTDADSDSWRTRRGLII